MAHGSGLQGFASMAPEKRRAIASRGARRLHALGKAHRWTHEAAVIAGRKGRSELTRRQNTVGASHWPGSRGLL